MYHMILNSLWKMYSRSAMMRIRNDVWKNPSYTMEGVDIGPQIIASLSNVFVFKTSEPTQKQLRPPRCFFPVAYGSQLSFRKLAGLLSTIPGVVLRVESASEKVEWGRPEMMIFDILIHPLLSNLQAKWIHRRRMVHANRHENTLAIEEYMTVIEMKAASAHTKAMALYNRALAHYSILNVTKSIDDLNNVLEIAGATGQARIESRRKLHRTERNTNRSDPSEPTAASSSQGGTNAGTESKTARRHSD